MKTRTLTMASALAAAALALTACSGGPADDGPVTLEFVLSGDANQGGGYQALADKYEEETGVQVRIIDVPYDDLVTRLRSGAQAGNLPALARASEVDPLWKDQLLDLTTIAEERDVMDSLLVENSDGAVQALPSDLTAVGLFLNKTLFDEAGVAYPGVDDEPWTWDEFVAALEEVQTATGARYGMVMDASAHRLRSFMYQFGSQGVQPQDDGTWALDDEGATALEFFAGINDDTIMPRSVWLSGEDPSAMFKSGQVAAYYSGVWQVTDFSQNISDFEWTTALMPAQTTRATNLGTNWIVGFDGTGVEEETLAFVDWLYSPENYSELAEISGFLPAVEGLEVQYQADAEAFDMYYAEIEASDPIAGDQSTTALQNGYDGRVLEHEPLKDETVKYLNGEQDLATTVREIGEQTTEAYAD